MLSRYGPEVVGDESAKARRFEWGLDPVLRKALVTVQLPTYTQVVDRSLSLEKEKEETRRQSRQQNKNNQNKGGSFRNQGEKFNQHPYSKGK